MFSHCETQNTTTASDELEGLGKSSNTMEVSYVEGAALGDVCFLIFVKKWPRFSKSQLNLGSDVRG